MATVYEIVTEQIVRALENGVVPWRKPWSGGHRAPMNISGREYRGINVFILGLASTVALLADVPGRPWSRGGHVRKARRAGPSCAGAGCGQGDGGGAGLSP